MISGALKALGNFNAGITKSLIELYIAVLASGGVPTVLASGVRTPCLTQSQPTYSRDADDDRDGYRACDMGSITPGKGATFSE